MLTSLSIHTQIIPRPYMYYQKSLFKQIKFILFTIMIAARLSQGNASYGGMGRYNMNFIKRYNFIQRIIPKNQVSSKNRTRVSVCKFIKCLWQKPGLKKKACYHINSFNIHKVRNGSKINYEIYANKGLLNTLSWIVSLFND